MTYKNSDQEYASGKSGRDRDINEMRARMSKPGKATAGDEILMNKWAQDVEDGNSSSASEDFVNAMKSEGGWTEESEGSGLKPPENENEPLPCSGSQEKDCLGICGGGRTAGEDGSCCRASERDCNGECFGSYVVIGDTCCDRTDPDASTSCCLNPIESCDPPCPKPGQIINGHQFNNGCWCTPGQEEHCCSASLLDSGGRCPEDAGYGLWDWEILEGACNCAEVPAAGLQPGAGFTSEEECLNKCNQRNI
jgi:hypothetical protein